jgi:hypothetical protein
MKRIVITTALALAIAAPAFANDQLARSLGVEPGAYTTAELATLKGLGESGDSLDRETATVLASLFSRGVVSTQSVGASGNAQLAQNLGVNAGDFTTAELATIKGITEQRATDDAFALSDLIGRGADGVVSTQSVGGISAGHAQIARNLGLDPADYSLAELAVIKGQAELDKNDN